MMYRKTLSCPVCASILGYLIKDEVCTFLCHDCQFMYTWDKKGKLLPPVQMNTKKSKKCTCGGCKSRDEQELERK